MSRQPYKGAKGFETGGASDGDERLKAIEARMQALPLHNLIVALPQP